VRNGRTISSTAHVAQDDLSVYFCGFHSLMPHRVEHVLLVSSLYESFILEEDGLFTEMITSEYLHLNLSHAPRVTRVSTAQEGLEVIDKLPVDLVITMTCLRDLTVAEFADEVKRLKPELPVVVLADEARSILRDPSLRSGDSIDRLFVWNGDAKILLAIIKFVEDQLNAEHDTKVGDVRVIILVENSVRFYSAYLPLIYTELMNLTQSLITEGVNPMHRLLRMRARPRILLADSFEEACDLYEKYSKNVLGVISDIRFPRDGVLDSTAGIEFTARVRANSPYLPVLLQSSDRKYEVEAARLGAGFVCKKSRNLLRHLREFILGNLGFGDFVFKMPDGRIVGRARDMRELEEALARVPVESIVFHANHNHFSNWLMARTEFEAAARLQPSRVSDFDTLEDMRAHLIRSLADLRARTQTGVITDFSPSKFDVASSFTRIGGGSIGGKARGLAFVNALIRRHKLSHRFDGVKIFVPNSATLGVDVFDRFLDENNLRSFVVEDVSDERVAEVFLAAKLPQEITRDLAAFLRFVRYPLAVRSSSILEDSQGRPFAGIYATHMLPNNHPDISIRLDQLCCAVKRVYASAFFQSAKRYLEATGRNPEEEKMGVILQEIVGSGHENRFYPTFSGVARSYNFYPTGHTAPEEGVACVALGLGKMVVEGGQSLMFSPAHPLILPQFATTEDMLANSQRQFYALDTSHPEVYPSSNQEANHLLLDLDVAERDGTLEPIGSVYSRQNDTVRDGIDREGTRLVTFAHVLKSNIFPLADILKLLLELGEEGTASPVEIEFAVDMSTDPMEFGFLQIRPIIVNEEYQDVSLDDMAPELAVCYSDKALGNGQVPGIRDIVYVRPEHFDSSRTREIAAEIGRLNETLVREHCSCVLIGPGRWGTADHWLGIPVKWEQISAAQVIVETTLEDFMITPSQGTHFFQNLTSLGIGYFSVDPNLAKGSIDWDWLNKQPTRYESRYVRHVRVDQFLEIRLDGRSQRGVIARPREHG
jgi:DNA-binding NarL/FixJ family response regulator